MYVVKLKQPLGPWLAGDLVIALTDVEPKPGDYIVASRDGRRVLLAYRPGLPWLATVVSTDMAQSTVELLTELTLALIQKPERAEEASDLAKAALRS